MKQRKATRRSFLDTALKGGALAGTASLTIAKDLFAQVSGPIVIGHHCDLTGVISSWGFWHDKCAKAAVDEGIKKMMNSGELEQLYAKWFLRPIPPRGAVINIPT